MGCMLMKQKNLWIMVGCPASGKSTYLANKALSNSVIVSRDAIRFNLLRPGDDYFSKEKEVFEKYKNLKQIIVKDIWQKYVPI